VVSRTIITENRDIAQKSVFHCHNQIFMLNQILSIIPVEESIYGENRVLCTGKPLETVLVHNEKHFEQPFPTLTMEGFEGPSENYFTPASVVITL